MNRYQDFTHFRCKQCDFLSFTSDDIDITVLDNIVVWILYVTHRYFRGMHFHRVGANGIDFVINCHGCHCDLGVMLSGHERIMVYKNAVKRNLAFRFSERSSTVAVIVPRVDNSVQIDEISSTSE